MNAQQSDENLAADPNIQLQKALIEEYLREQGYSIEKLKDLPAETAKQLMVEASKHASLKLEEIEARAHFVKTLHDSNPT